jgi:hypothetical protein
MPTERLRRLTVPVPRWIRRVASIVRDEHMNMKLGEVAEISDLRRMRRQGNSTAGPEHSMYAVTSAHFRQRAKQYRYAAALTDKTRDRERFCDLAFMFDRIADEFL